MPAIGSCGNLTLLLVLLYRRQIARYQAPSRICPFPTQEYRLALHNEYVESSLVSELDQGGWLALDQPNSLAAVLAAAPRGISATLLCTDTLYYYARRRAEYRSRKTAGNSCCEGLFNEVSAIPPKLCEPGLLGVGG